MASQQELQQLYPAMPDLEALPQAQYLLAQQAGVAVGCVAMLALADEVADQCPARTSGRMVEIKRLFVQPPARGRGIARRLLQALEALALQQQVAVIRVETGYLQHAALTLYPALDYQSIPAYGPYVGQSFSRCFEKRLG